MCFTCLSKKGSVFLLILFEVTHRNNMLDLSLGRHGLCFCTEVWEWNSSTQKPQLHVLFFKVQGEDCFWGETRELTDASAGSTPLQNTELVTCWNLEARKGELWPGDTCHPAGRQAVNTPSCLGTVSVIISHRKQDRAAAQLENTFLREKTCRIISDVPILTNAVCEKQPMQTVFVAQEEIIASHVWESLTMCTEKPQVLLGLGFLGVPFWKCNFQ